MAKIKYMGIADARLFPKGDTFNNQLPDGLSADVLFDWDNNHVVDTGKLNLSDDEVGLLLGEPDMRDVTSLKRIPVGDAEKTWRGVGAAATATADKEDDDSAETGSAVTDKANKAGGSTKSTAT